MDSSLRTIALANRSGQIEGPTFAQQKGNKLTLRAGRGQEDRSMPLGRYSDDDTSPPSPGRPSAAPAALVTPPPPSLSPPAATARPFPPGEPVRVLRITPRPCCVLSVSPFRSLQTSQRPRGSVSRLIKRRKLANEISIRLRNTLGIVSFPTPTRSFLLFADRLIFRDPGFVVICTRPLDVT